MKSLMRAGALALAVCLLTGGCGAAAPAAVGDSMEMAAEAGAIAGMDGEMSGETHGGTDMEDTTIIAPAPADSGDTAADSPSLQALFSGDFRVGVAVQAIDHWNDPSAEIGNPDKEALILREFNSITFGNEWKPAYNFDPASPTLYRTNPAVEELLSWAKENGVPVRGHTLVWHSQCDPAIFAVDFRATAGGAETHDWNAALDEDCLVDRDTLIERLRMYIDGVMEYVYAGGYADTVYAFDVVNEATDEANADGLRHSYYYQIIGPEYLYYCFLFAREAELRHAAAYASLYGLNADTDDLSPILPALFYNDYNEWYAQRTETILRFLTKERYNEGGRLSQSDVITADGDGTICGDGLIDGIGMQGHLDDTQNIEQYIRALRAYDAAVDAVQITELDVGRTAAGEQGFAKQALFYYTFFQRLLAERRDGVNLNSVTFWGLTDDTSWRHGADPLLFAGDLSKKPAWYALEAAARGEEYTLEDAAVIRDASDLMIDFEPRTEGGSLVFDTPEKLGFRSRGSGHQASLKIVSDENHTADAAVGRSLRVQRAERDASVQFDLSRFIGETVRVSLWCRTADAELSFGYFTDEGEETLDVLSSDGAWLLCDAAIDLRETKTAAGLWIETDGSAEIYIDDVTVRVAED